MKVLARCSGFPPLWDPFRGGARCRGVIAGETPFTDNVTLTRGSAAYLNIANPFRNVKLLDVMSSWENTMDRTVLHKPSMIQEPHLRAVQGEVDLENASEVNMVSYMSKRTS